MSKNTVRKYQLKETLTNGRRFFRNVRITADGHAPYFSKYREVVVGLKWLAANIPEAAVHVVSRRMRGEPAVPKPFTHHHSKFRHEVDATGEVKHVSIGYMHPNCRCAVNSKEEAAQWTDSK